MASRRKRPVTEERVDHEGVRAYSTKEGRRVVASGEGGYGCQDRTVGSWQAG